MYDYTRLTFTELVNKIGSSRYFNLPAMLKEILSRLSDASSIESVTGDFVDNTDPLNPEINVNEVNLGQVINDRLSIKLTPSPNDEFVILDSITGEAVTVFYSTIKPYKVYTALLSQSGTDAPVATVLENTLGFTPIYTYSSTGVYALSPLEDFSNFLNKGVVIFLNKGSNDSTNATNSISCAYNYEDGALEIRTYANGLASDGILSDVDSFQKTSFEIRVYN